MSGSGRRAARVGVGALVGAVPGAVLVGLTLPVSGEAELTLGVAGTGVALIGAVIGALVGAAREDGRRG